MNNRVFKTVAALVGLIIITFALKAVLLQGLSTTSLGAAPPLAGAVSQSLGLAASRSALPIFDKDYTIDDAHYFYNNQWAVVTVNPTKADADTVIIVMKKINGVYQPILGPGTVFSTSFLYTLPPDVGQYLNQKGVLNG